MPTVWFVLVAFMLTAYVVLDGFDLGVGTLHLFVARTDQERRMVIQTIGPVWDGNEVWLIAGGGTLFFAFPLLYASSFSGFYLPLAIVLWLLIMRAIGIEFRRHIDIAVWATFFDGWFAIASGLLTVFFGAAFANVIRGVPLDADGFFFEPLWTNWRVGPHPGILDWYTVAAGLLALFALAMHGGLYLSMKATGKVADRSRWLASASWILVVVFSAIELAASLLIRPGLSTNYLRRPIWFVVPAIVLISLLLIPYFMSRRLETKAFLASAAYLVGMMAGAAVALYPVLLPASTNPAYSLTIYSAAAGYESLRLGLYWWLPGIALAITYFVLVYRMFRGKVGAGGTYEY